MIWVWTTVAYAVVCVSSLFLIDSKGINSLLNMGWIGLLLGWYFTQGKSQIEYVGMAFPNGYAMRSWGVPLGIGFGSATVYIIAVILIATAAYKPDPTELAAEVRPLILKE